MMHSIQKGFVTIQAAHRDDDSIAQRARDGATLAGIVPVDAVQEVRIKRSMARIVSEIGALVPQDGSRATSGQHQGAKR